jgi:hypothetical protein
MTFPNHEHLSKTYLTDEMNHLAHRCREWLRETAFEPIGDFNVTLKCRVKQNNRDLMSLITSGESDSVGSLLNDLNSNCTNASNQINMKYNGVRFTKTSTLRVREGETVVLVPLYVESGSPTVDGVPVADGEILWLKETVVIEPRFFCLMALTRSYLPK